MVYLSDSNSIQGSQYLSTSKTIPYHFLDTYIAYIWEYPTPGSIIYIYTVFKRYASLRPLPLPTTPSKLGGLIRRG